MSAVLKDAAAARAACASADLDEVMAIESAIYTHPVDARQFRRFAARRLRVPRAAPRPRAARLLRADGGRGRGAPAEPFDRRRAPARRPRQRAARARLPSSRASSARAACSSRCGRATAARRRSTRASASARSRCGAATIPAHAGREDALVLTLRAGVSRRAEILAEMGLAPVWRLRGKKPSTAKSLSPTSWIPAEGRGLRLHEMRPAQDAHADGVRRRRRERRLDADRRGAGRGGGPAGRPVRRPGGQAARQHARGDRPVAARERLHRQRAQVPAAGQPQPGAGRSRAMHAAPAAADRADQAEADRGDGPLRGADAARDRCHRSPACAAACTATPACRSSSPTTRPTCCATLPDKAKAWEDLRVRRETPWRACRRAGYSRGLCGSSARAKASRRSISSRWTRRLRQVPAAAPAVMVPATNRPNTTITE